MHRRKESLSWIGKPCIHLPSCNFAQVCLVFIFISHCDRNFRRQLAPCALSLRAEEPGSDSESLNLGSCHNLFTLVCVYKKQSKTKQNPKAKPSLTRRKNLERNTTRGSWLYVTSFRLMNCRIKQGDNCRSTPVPLQVFIWPVQT